MPEMAVVFDVDVEFVDDRTSRVWIFPASGVVLGGDRIALMGTNDLGTRIPVENVRRLTLTPRPMTADEQRSPGRESGPQGS